MNKKELLTWKKTSGETFSYGDNVEVLELSNEEDGPYGIIGRWSGDMGEPVGKYYCAIESGPHTIWSGVADTAEEARAAVERAFKGGV